jgi:hypothetical protein
VREAHAFLAIDYKVTATAPCPSWNKDGIIAGSVRNTIFNELEFMHLRILSLLGLLYFN